MNDEAFAEALSREAVRLPNLRACSPEETLRTIAPALPACGITRAASVTQLDRLGVPVWISVRPGGQVLQVSNGKGVTDAAAKVSALMEACELHLAENPRPERLRRCSMAQLAKAEPHARVVPPAELPGGLDRYFTPDFTGEWASGTNMDTGDRVWVPSSVVYFFRRPTFFETSSNGLASGNTRAEARLHAIYEADRTRRDVRAGRARTAEAARARAGDRPRQRDISGGPTDPRSLRRPGHLGGADRVAGSGGRVGDMGGFSERTGDLDPEPSSIRGGALMSIRKWLSRAR